MFKNAIISKVRQSYELINARADRDKTYRKKVLENPHKAIFEATGFAIPRDWKLSVIDLNGRLRIKIVDEEWLNRFGLTKSELKRNLGEIIY